MKETSLEAYVQSKLTPHLVRILQLHGVLIVDAPELYAEVSKAVLEWLIANVPDGALDGFNAIPLARGEKPVDEKWWGTVAHSECRFELRYLGDMLRKRVVVTVFKGAVPLSLNAFAAEYLQ